MAERLAPPPPGILFRVFQGADCEYRYVAGTPDEATDHIVWGEHLYNLRLKWRPMNLLTVLTQVAERARRRVDRNAGQK